MMPRRKDYAPNPASTVASGQESHLAVRLAALDIPLSPLSAHALLAAIARCADHDRPGIPAWCFYPSHERIARDIRRSAQMATRAHAGLRGLVTPLGRHGTARTRMRRVEAAAILARAAEEIARRKATGAPEQ